MSNAPSKPVSFSRPKVGYFSNRPRIVLKGRWLHIIVVNVHAPSEEKSEEVKDSFYEELEEVFDHFTKILYESFTRRL